MEEVHYLPVPKIVPDPDILKHELFKSKKRLHPPFSRFGPDGEKRYFPVQETVFGPY